MEKNIKDSKFLIIVLLVAVVLVGVTGGLYFKISKQNQELSRLELQYAQRQAELQRQEEERRLQDWDFTIVSVGDIMSHTTQTNAGKKPDGSYDFSYEFDYVREYIENADLAVGNLETPLGAPGEYTGFPRFNAPPVLASDLVETGFDVVSTANNHSVDKGFAGICSTVDALDEAGLYHTGTYKTEEDAEKILHYEINGLDIGFISASYGSNGLTVEKDFSLDLIQKDRLLEKISQARKEGAQLVVMMLHWGVEYQESPNSNQTELAKELLRGGADLILGNHPHVLQKSVIYNVEDLNEEESDLPLISDKKASGKDTKKFVSYSQGNFVSNQQDFNACCSTILQITIGVDGLTQQPYFKDARYIPTFVAKKTKTGEAHHQVWPLEKALMIADTPENPFNSADKERLEKWWDYVLNSQPNIEVLHVE